MARSSNVLSVRSAFARTDAANVFADIDTPTPRVCPRQRRTKLALVISPCPMCCNLPLPTLAYVWNSSDCVSYRIPDTVKVAGVGWQETFC